MSPTTCLFITHSFPSIGSANSLCDERLICFRSKSEKVVVLCYRFPGQEKHETQGNIEIVRVWKDEFWGIERLARSSSKNRFYQKATKLIYRLRQLLYLPFFPNYERIAVHVLFKNAVKIVRENNIGNLFADFNGTDTLLGGYKAAKKTRINFYPIFWDGLSVGMRSRYVSASFNDRRKKALEKKIIDSSRLSFFLNQAKDKLLFDYSDRPDLIKKMRFFGLPLFNPMAGNSRERSAREESQIVFICGGSLLGRDFIPFFSEIGGLFENNLKILLYPTTYSPEEIKKIRQFSFVEICGVLSAAEFTKQCLKSDILIAGGVKSPYLPTGKLYEFFATGKPVIYLCRNEADPALSDIKKYPLSYVFYDNSSLNSAEALKAFIQKNRQARLSKNEMDNLFPENRPETFWKLINDLEK